MVIIFFVGIKTFLSSVIIGILIVIFVFIVSKIKSTALDMSFLYFFRNFQSQIQILKFLICKSWELVLGLFVSLVRILVVSFDFGFFLFVKELPVFFLMLFKWHSMFWLPWLVVGILGSSWGYVCRNNDQKEQKGTCPVHFYAKNIFIRGSKQSMA